MCDTRSSGEREYGVDESFPGLVPGGGDVVSSWLTEPPVEVAFVPFCFCRDGGRDLDRSTRVCEEGKDAGPDILRSGEKPPGGIIAMGMLGSKGRGKPVPGSTICGASGESIGWAFAVQEKVAIPPGSRLSAGV